jgi:hypothetical protein
MLPLYTQTTDDVLVATNSIYSLVVEAIATDALAKSDADLRTALTLLVNEFDAYRNEALNELHARGMNGATPAI